MNEETGPERVKDLSKATIQVNAVLKLEPVSLECETCVFFPHHVRASENG